VDRGRKEITIRFGAERTETFRLTDRAAEEATGNVAPEGTTVVIYYADEGGQRVAHYFKTAK
jgi:diadenosine tetraphosphate (Ap4A) HIT family hydrolase